MDLIDFILNLAGLLLWLNWRSIRLDPFTRATPATLAGTLRRAEPSRLKRWHFLAGLAALLLGRTIFYWAIGPEVSWVPKLDLSVVAPAFRGRSFPAVLLFSLLSFLRVLVIFYFWLLALAVINRRVKEPDALQKLILLQLGRPGRWPWVLQIVLPLILVTALWIGLHPALVYAGVMDPVQSTAHLLGQGLLIGAGIYFSLKLLLPAILFAHLIGSYVYLGRSPVWDFAGGTARNLLRPLNFLPLRFGKVDVAPLAGIIVLLLLLHVLPNFVRAELMRRKLDFWPL
jgi:uncharacterized protein YggT (Ycf19 family)